MLFNSFIFFVFLAIVLPVFYMLKENKSKVRFLVLSSYIFYSYWDIRFTALVLLSTFVDFFIAKKIDASESPVQRKRLVTVSLLVNLGILGFFKYFNFFLDSFQDLLMQFGLEFSAWQLQIALPVGISFYTFQTLSYTLDVYKGRQKASDNFAQFSLYVCFFPQLVAGPIERAENLLKQFAGKLKPDRQQINDGIHLLVLGLFKKVMIGDAAARIVDPIFANYSHYDSLELFCALLLFSIQIYADFSGYTSIARGVAKLMGINLIKNFDEPYLSRTITEFWRRWHISLSSWLRDYLYIPLGGNRKGHFHTYRNLMLTMLLGGLWHGANWTFVLWGGLHGLYLAVDKWIKREKRFHFDKVELGWRGIPGIVLTFFLVLLTWLFFRSENIEQAFDILGRMAQLEYGQDGTRIFWMTLGFLCMSFGLDLLQRNAGKQTFLFHYLSKEVSFFVLMILLVVSFAFMLQNKALPFIYFQF